MITTMDAAGRIVLPKAVRERAQLTPGAPIDVRVVDGRVELEPVSARVTIENRSGTWVAAPVDPMPTLTRDLVDATIDALRTPGVDRARDSD